ncbi:signal peptidase I [Candidatus Acetothermia bacterium]|nr:MAG: signal peptidase I [Candidatus Acetothermia bacterium]
MNWRWPWRRKKEPKPAWIVRFLRRRGYKLSRRAEWALGWLETIVVAGGAAWLIISFITVRMTVPTGSMIPTIMPGDSFFVDRVSYYFRKPDVGDVIVFWHVEEIRITGVKPGSPAQEAGVVEGDYLLELGGEPVPSTVTLKRRIEAAAGGELALALGREGVGRVELTVSVPADADSLSDLGITARIRRARYVKRLIAVGGQEVWIGDGGRIYVDGQPLQVEPIASHTYWSHDPRMRYGIQPTPVPEGHYFVLGDNTMNSFDSRYWGFVPVEDFIGEPFFRVWPFSRFGPMNGYLWSSR